MRNTKLIKLLCLVLCIFMAFALLGACAETDDTASSSSKKNSTSSKENADNTGDDNTGDNNNDDFGGDITPEAPDSGEDLPYDEEQLPEEEEEEFEEENYDYYSESVHVFNGEAPLSTKYRGMSSSVYHAFGHMLDDKTGRAYTDEMMELELNRLQDCGIRYARTRFTTSWFWDTAKNMYDWDGAARANYFYTYCKNLQKRDISVVLSVGWHLGCFTHIESGSIDEVGYITKSELFPDDVYGETAGYDFSKCKNDEYRRMAKESLRFGYFYAETLRQCRARGINNITHFLYFTEPSYSTSLPEGHPARGFEGPSPDEYMFIVNTIMDKLREEKVYDMVTHVGPNQGSIQHGDGLLRYILERQPDMFDVWTAHFYPQAAEGTDNVYYDIIDPVFRSYVQPLKDVGIWKTKHYEFWVDEFYCRNDKATLGKESPWNGLQTALGGLIAQQRGIENVSLWQVFDQLWTDQTNSGGEFVNGIHSCGSVPSLFISSIPRSQYYSPALFSRYNGYKNGKSFRTNEDELAAYASDIHVGASQLEDGSWTITIINAGVEEYNVTVEFDKAIYQTLYRHVNNVNTNVPTTAAKLAEADKTFVTVKDKFVDKVPGGCIAVYTGVKG